MLLNAPSPRSGDSHREVVSLCQCDEWSLIVWTGDKMAGRIITRCVSRALVEFGSGANCVKSRGTNRNYWTALRRTSTALTVNNDASFSSKITLLHSLSHCFLYLYASSVICAQEGQWCHFLGASYLVYRWRGNGFVNAVRAAYPCRKRTTSTVVMMLLCLSALFN